nr:unnamed protein product [Digitaria exilis]
MDGGIKLGPCWFVESAAGASPDRGMVALSRMVERHREGKRKREGEKKAEIARRRFTVPMRHDFNNGPCASAIKQPNLSKPHCHICAAASDERVEITNKHGEKLVGLLHHTGSNKIVVLCHGFISTKNDSLILDLTAALTKKGISVFHFDFSGNGFPVLANMFSQSTRIF